MRFFVIFFTKTNFLFRRFELVLAYSAHGTRPIGRDIFPFGARCKTMVRITDGREEFVVELNKPMMGVYIPKMIWKDMYDFSPDSVLLVLASTHYDGKEYIRDFDEYLQVMGIKR